MLRRNAARCIDCRSTARGARGALVGLEWYACRPATASGSAELPLNFARELCTLPLKSTAHSPRGSGDAGQATNNCLELVEQSRLLAVLVPGAYQSTQSGCRRSRHCLAGVRAVVNAAHLSASQDNITRPRCWRRGRAGRYQWGRPCRIVADEVGAKAGGAYWHTWRDTISCSM